MTRPAMPRKDAADRYSPPMAEAFHSGETVREATRKSLVVRASRRPYMPMPTVAATTRATASSGRAASFTRQSSRALDQVGEVALVALGQAQVEPAARYEPGVDQH